MSIQTSNVTTSTASVYVSSGNTAVTWLSLCNYSAGNVTANVYVVPSGNVAGNLNCVYASLNLTTLDTYQMYVGSEKILLGNGDSIQINVSANSAVAAVTSYTSL